MGILTEYLNRRLVNAAVKRDAEQNALASQKDAAVASIKRAEERMFSKKCKLAVDGEYCSSACAHFKRGHVWIFDGGSAFGTKWIDAMPECKLWRRA